MARLNIKQKLFLLSVKLPIVTISLIVIILVSLIIITNIKYVNVYIEQSAEINYSKDINNSFIKLYIDKKEIKQIPIGINTEVLWYLEQEGEWHEAFIVEIVEDAGKKAYFLKIEPVKKDIEKEFMDKAIGTYPVNVKILTGKEKIAKRLFGGES